jgi:hypothetical protein
LSLKMMENDTRLLCRIRTMLTRFLKVVRQLYILHWLKCTERKLEKKGLVQKYDDKIAEYVD